MPHQVFQTKSEYEKAYNDLVYTKPTEAYSIIPVFPPEEIERIYTEDMDGFRFACAVLLDSGEKQDDLAKESEIALKQIEDKRKCAYSLWDKYGR